MTIRPPLPLRVVTVMGCAVLEVSAVRRGHWLFGVVWAVSLLSWVVVRVEARPEGL